VAASGLPLTLSPWLEVYRQDPCGGSPPELCKLILGGHGEMWGETVDESDLEQTVWPRLAAIAEKLWSQEADTKDTVT
jgi:hexosaminidase